MWNSKEGITVKMDTIGKVEGKKMRMKIELKNLKIEKQNPKLFEIPSGYSKLSFDSGGFNMKDIMKNKQAKPADEGRSYTAEGRDYTAQGRSYTAEGRDYTAQGRSYTAEGRDYTAQGRSYTAEPRNNILDKIKKKLPFKW